MVRKVKIHTRRNEVGDWDALPKKRNRVLCVVLKENKSTVWKWVSFRKDNFTLDGNYYFVDPRGTYISQNKILVSIYLEGISTPMNHKNIQKEVKERNFIDPISGKEKKRRVTLIKGLKFDSTLIDMLLNRKLVDVFTRHAMDLPNVIIIILLLVCIGVGVAGLGVALS